MAWVIYPKFKELQFGGLAGSAIDFEGGDQRILLVDSGYSYSAAHDFVDDVVAGSHEVTGSNYARKALTGEGVTLGGSGSATLTYDASNPTAYSQHASGFTDARYAVLYEYNASDSAAALIAYYDFGANKGNVTGTLTLEFSASGIFTLT